MWFAAFPSDSPHRALRRESDRLHGVRQPWVHSIGMEWMLLGKGSGKPRVQRLRTYSYFQHFEGDSYRLSALSGALLRFPDATLPQRRVPEEVRRFIDLCDDPFRLQDDRFSAVEPAVPADTEGARRVLRRMLACAARSFLAARLYAACRSPIFPSSAAAIRWFHANTEPGMHSKLCLPRALFAAKTSVEFADHGAVIVGCLLPMRNLHAWVLERDAQPDDEDRIWVCYRPVAVLR